MSTAVMSPITETKANQLSEKTVFLLVHFGSIGNTRKIDDDSILDTEADKDLLKVSKTLLDSVELSAIRKADSGLRAWIREDICLPFEASIYLLPVDLIEQVQVKLVEHQAKRESLVTALVNAYPKLKDEAEQRLGSLYNPKDYPSAEKLRSLFTFGWRYISMVVPGQLKGISSAMFQAEQAKAEKAMQEAAQDITLLMRQTLLELVSHLQDRLKPGSNGKPKKLHETAVTNLQDFLKNFEQRNVTGDVELAEQVKKAKALIAGTNAEALRSSDDFKKKILEGMSQITGSLNGLVEEKAGRKFRQD